MNLLRRFQTTNPDKLLGGRYKIISELGAGGFGQTFLAEDLHLPGHPQCVVKQLKPQVSDEASLQTARRLFDVEAQVLCKLGNHDQIPRLLAHFEENQEFYLAQELIEGEPLSKELVSGQPWQEQPVIALLQDMLHVLAFVHDQQVIHRDIKPSNLIRRRADGKIVLIDFGAVKQVSTQIINSQGGHTRTISIGTQGYTPNEQLGGNPRFSSDVYAVGIIGIQALTGIHPKRLSEDPETGEIDWRDRAPQVSPELAEILDCMVRYDFRVRYQTAGEALEVLQSLETAAPSSQLILQALSEATAEATEESTKQAPQFSSSAANSSLSGASSATNSTASGTDLSSTNIWVPTEPSVQSSASASKTGSGQPLSQPNRSQSSGSAAPTTTTIAVTQRRSYKPWLILGALVAVGATALIVKTFIFPQWSIQSVDRNGSTTSPTPGTTQTPTPSSSASPTISLSSSTDEQPTPSSSSRPGNSPSPNTEEEPKPSSSDSPATSPSPNTEEKPKPSSSVNPGAIPKPSPPPAKPSTKPAPPRTEPRVTELLSQGDRLREAGQYQKALSLYDQVIAQKPDIAEAQWGRCYSLNSLQQPAEAIAACNKALDLNPNYPEALWSKGSALDQQQRPADALKFYERATALKPDFAEAWNNQGVALLNLNRAREAVNAFKKATDLKPEFADAWANRGAALWKLGRNRQAIASLDRALQIQPNNATAINLRQQAREKLGR